MKLHLAVLALAASAVAVDASQRGVVSATENEPVYLNSAHLVAIASAEKKRRQEAAAAPAGEVPAGPAIAPPAPEASPVAAPAESPVAAEAPAAEPAASPVEAPATETALPAASPVAAPAAETHSEPAETHSEPAAHGDAAGHAEADPAAHGDTAAHGDAHGEGSHYTYPAATPPVNPEFPLAASGSVMIGMGILGVLIVGGAGGILGYLWMGKKKSGAQDSEQNVASGVSIGESAMQFGDKN